MNLKLFKSIKINKNLYFEMVMIQCYLMVLMMRLGCFSFVIGFMNI